MASHPAETYEHYMVPPLFAPSADRLLDIAKPRPGERVLDVATGTGVVARAVVPRVGPTGTVIGLDLSPGMLEVARATSARAGLAIAWHEGRAEALPFADCVFDLVTCQFALMFFADRHSALSEMRRVLVDTGRVAVSVFQRIDCHPFYVALDESIERRLGSSGVAGIFSLGDADALRTMLTDAGFREIDFAPFTVTARFPSPDLFIAGEIDVDTASIPAMQHLDAAARQELTAAIRDDVAEPLRVVTDGDHVVLPFHCYAVRGYRGGPTS